MKTFENIAEIKIVSVKITKMFAPLSPHKSNTRAVNEKIFYYVGQNIYGHDICENEENWRRVQKYPDFA